MANETMGRGRKITNRSVFLNEHAWRLLWKIARQIETSQVWAEELVSEGWFKAVRYCDETSVKGAGRHIKRQMLRYLYKRNNEMPGDVRLSYGPAGTIIKTKRMRVDLYPSVGIRSKKVRLLDETREERIQAHGERIESRLP